MTEGTSGARMTRRQLLRRFSGVGVAAGMAICAACAPTREQTRLLIKMLPQNQLQPAGVTVRPGTTVTWYNMGQWPQTATCDPQSTKDPTLVLLPKGAAAWDSGVLYPGQSWSYTFQTPGSYRYYSRAQTVGSMVGTVAVLKQ